MPPPLYGPDPWEEDQSDRRALRVYGACLLVLVLGVGAYWWLTH